MMSKNLGKPINTPILSEKVAIDLGANLLGEFMLFFLGSVVLVSEYCRYHKTGAIFHVAYIQGIGFVKC